ncbi:hypothetical protein NDU88_003507 [Pleurodeles waltl]|uniref:Uncharacterized protein n=1 Tax=Pleurodeles waltl TaxID=8319 RepID=A0AAV7T6N4_PLEWA|nr:hypothetical protein NDU88_003507 [Pleurodeles waltl]
MDQYTTPSPLPQRQTHMGGPVEVLGTPAAAEEPLHGECLAAIQSSRVALEVKIETVAVEVNLFRADLRKVFYKVKVVKGTIVDLQTEVGALRKKIAHVTSTVWMLELIKLLFGLTPLNEHGLMDIGIPSFSVYHMQNIEM